jgi:hypothetical protein
VPGPILGAIAMARLRAIDGPSAVGSR